MRRRVLAILAVLLLAAALTIPIGVNLDPVRRPPRAWAEVTTGAWASMIHVFRTDSGVVVVDLGWVGAERALREALGKVGATPDDVVAVLLTHSHRDHIAAWPLLRGARFYMGAEEVLRFLGREAHRGPITRLAESVRETSLPREGELRIVGFTRDTTLVFGRDTIRAYPIPGHTAGSAAYLVDGVLFVGDAANRRPFAGFGGARPEYSDDVARSRESMRALFARLEGQRVDALCTAHAKCAAYDAGLRERVGR